MPDRERLEQCLAIFRSARKAQQQLETLYLLADIHRRNNDLRGELDIIQRSIDLAEAVNDPVWLFYLYSYLGDMYRREGDLVRFARYQETAKGYIASVPEVELAPHTHGCSWHVASFTPDSPGRHSVCSFRLPVRPRNTTCAMPASIGCWAWRTSVSDASGMQPPTSASR